MSNKILPFWDSNTHPITGFHSREKVYNKSSDVQIGTVIDSSFIAKNRNRLNIFIFNDKLYNRNILQRMGSSGEAPEEFFNIRLKPHEPGYRSPIVRVDLEEYKELQRDNKIL